MCRYRSQIGLTHERILLSLGPYVSFLLFLTVIHSHFHCFTHVLATISAVFFISLIVISYYILTLSVHVKNHLPFLHHLSYHL